MSWRSPPMLPRPVDPAGFPPPADPLGRLALGASWRLRAFAHALGHGLRRVPSPAHADVAARMGAALAASDRFLADAGSGDVALGELRVQAHLESEPLPLAASLAEVSMADALFGSALDQALSQLAGSTHDAFALAAAAGMGAPFGNAVLESLAEDSANRSCLQLLVERWAAHAVHVLGRPGSAGDAALVGARVKPRSSIELLADWLAAAERRLEPWGLHLPDAAFMAVEVPAGWKPARLRR